MTHHAPITPAASSDTAILDNLLLRLAPYYLADHVEELVINQPGELWIKKRYSKDEKSSNAKVWSPIKDPALTWKYLSTLCTVIANTYSSEFGPTTEPTLYATLPGGHRFTAIMGPNVVYNMQSPKGGIAMAIRQAPKQDTGLTFSDWGLEKGKPLPDSFHSKDDDAHIEDKMELLIHRLRSNHDILISGATSTGKTRFLDCLLDELSIDERIITLEDTRELYVKQLNHIHLLLQRTNQNNNFTYPKAIDLIKRMTPDRIIPGEISSQNAVAMMDLVGSGHGSVLCTVHADKPEEARQEVIACMKKTDPHLDEAAAMKRLERFTVVQIERQGSERVITALE